MATDHSSAGRDAAHMDPDQVLTVAVEQGQAIRCTTAHGRVTRFVPVLTPGFDGVTWCAVDEPDGSGTTVTETHVRNAVRRCQPDVELVERPQPNGGSIR